MHLSNLFPDYPALHDACHKYPAIDNHAHPLLKLAHRDEMTFENVISDANGEALQDSVNSLACFQATYQLAKLFGLKGSDVTWEKVKATGREMEYGQLCRLCFDLAKIQCILIDDGLGGSRDIAEGYKWHDKLTTSPTKRIVRLEVAAEDILVDILAANLAYRFNSPIGEILEIFTSRFRDMVCRSENDTEVVGYKSIAAYRTGLAISTSGSETEIRISLAVAIRSYYESAEHTLRLQHKAFNDYLLRLALDIAKKPVQFHTGLGDPDLLLATATPTLLQPLIRAYPKVTFVLLHASWPFSKEAGYLAMMHKKVFLDCGEVFPQVSPEGQRDLIRALLQLCPTNKLMWSTDGHWWPEVFYLGSVQAREALYDVLSDSVKRGELTEGRAVEVVKNVLFGNANRVYGLGLEPHLISD